MLFEPTFVSDNKVIAELAAKYQFSVFDFALAKKESHFKQLVNELVSDSAGISSYWLLCYINESDYNILVSNE